MNKHAQALGRKGGKVTSPAKARAARENGRKGGPRQDCGTCGVRMGGWTLTQGWYCLMCGTIHGHPVSRR